MNRKKEEGYFQANKKLWDELTSFHEKSSFYDVRRFKRGESSLNSIEIQELGDVQGKSLLHLQCHFGLDTLSWARAGAIVTGIDFSEKAIDLANSLSKELQIDARFIQGNIYDLRDMVDDTFDVVFTSYGVLAWLPDLEEWAQLVRDFLNDQGIFYMVEFHPILEILDNDGNVRHSYFPIRKPYVYKAHGSYAGPIGNFNHTQYEWQHTLSDIMNSLTNAGLRIEFVHEFPYSVYGDRPFLVQGEDGRWRHKNTDIQLPMLFSIKAHRH